MSTIISISNHKGGVGKTTTTLNLGAGLAQLGATVLLVDLDPQANLSQSVKIENEAENTYSLLKGMRVEASNICKGLDILPSTLDLSGAEVELVGEAGREFILKEALSSYGKYDYILIDCPPSLGLLTLNALTASRYVVIPIQAQYLAVQGITKLNEVIAKIQTRLNKELEIGGVVVTQYDSRKILNREVAESIGMKYKGLMFEAKIRDNVAIAEAPLQGLDIFRYNPKSYGAEDYLQLSRELLSRM